MEETIEEMLDRLANEAGLVRDLRSSLYSLQKEAEDKLDRTIIFFNRFGRPPQPNEMWRKPTKKGLELYQEMMLSMYVSKALVAEEITTEEAIELIRPTS